MNRIGVCGITMAAVCALAAAGCTTSQDEDASTSSTYALPSDVSADDVLGTDPARPATNATAAAPLQIPPGAARYRDAAWSGGDPLRAWGTVREYQYDPPVTIETRRWVSARALVGWDEPHYAEDSYGAVSLIAVVAHIDPDGELTAVSASDYDRLTDIRFGENPPGTTESG